MNYPVVDGGGGASSSVQATIIRVFHSGHFLAYLGRYLGVQQIFNTSTGTIVL